MVGSHRFDQRLRSVQLDPTLAERANSMVEQSAAASNDENVIFPVMISLPCDEGRGWASLSVPDVRNRASHLSWCFRNAITFRS